MSLGTNADSKSLHDAVDKAYKRNRDRSRRRKRRQQKPVNYPGAYSSVTAVSASTEKRARVFSTTGKQIEFAAPGTNITSTYLNQMYATADGTSRRAARHRHVRAAQAEISGGNKYTAPAADAAERQRSGRSRT